MQGWEPSRVKVRLIVAIVVIVLGGVIFVLWREMRRRADLLAQKQQELDGVRDALARTQEEVTRREQTDHDVSRWISKALVSAEMVQERISDNEHHFMIDQLTAAKDLLHASQGFEVVRPVRAASEIFLSSARAYARYGIELDIANTGGDLPYSGDVLQVERIVDNLMGNAAREASRCQERRVRLSMQDGEFRVTNPVTDVQVAQSSIRDRVSGSGSTGLGLKIIDNLSADVGWSVDYEVSESPAEVTARIRRRAHGP